MDAFVPCPASCCRRKAPYEYCEVCRAEWERRHRIELDRASARRRELRAGRRAQRSAICVGCKGFFYGKRRDAAYCPASCRQKAYRGRSNAPSATQRTTIRKAARDLAPSPEAPLRVLPRHAPPHPEAGCPCRRIFHSPDRWRCTRSTARMTVFKWGVESPADAGSNAD
jgi:hypothetical protein